MIKKDRTKLLTIISGLIGLLIIFFLAYRYIAPFGRIVNYRFSSKLPGAQEATVFSPGKESILNIPTQIITTSKTKLQIQIPSSKIETVKAILKFKPTVNEILLGVKGKEKDNFTYKPLYRDLLYYVNWEKIEDNGITLWQKEKKYQTLIDFIKNPPQEKTIGYYFVNLDKLSNLQSIKIEKEARTAIETPLRGNHTFLVRVDQKPLLIKITKQDLNMYEGADKVKIVMKNFNSQTVLAEKTIEDDGIVDGGSFKSKAQEEVINLPDIATGIYEVNLSDESTGSDSLITKIEINQNKVILIKNLFILGNKPTTIWTNSSRINISTLHDIGFQTIKLDNTFDLKIEQRDKKYLFDLMDLTKNSDGNKLYKLVSPKNDLVIHGDGYFSFDEKAFFLPEIIKGVNLSGLSNIDDFSFILASYQQPKKEGDWLVAEATFNLQDLNVEGDKLYFSLEIPQIAKYGGELEIDYLDISMGDKKAIEKKEITKTVEKNSLIDKGWAWLVEKFNQVKPWVSNTWQKFFKKTPKTDNTDNKGVVTITNTSLSPSPIPSPKPSPSPSPIQKITNFIRILNGGAGEGQAGVLAKVLLEIGFTNVTAETADKTDYKNAIIKYRQEDEKIVAILEELLKKDYKTVDKQKIATSSAEIVVIIGAK